MKNTGIRKLTSVKINAELLHAAKDNGLVLGRVLEEGIKERLGLLDDASQRRALQFKKEREERIKHEKAEHELRLKQSMKYAKLREIVELDVGKLNDTAYLTELVDDMRKKYGNNISIFDIYNIKGTGDGSANK